MSCCLCWGQCWQQLARSLHVEQPLFLLLFILLPYRLFVCR
jgi:hypothetical protein